MLATGCGGGTGELNGTVTYKGQPLHTGSVLVFGRDGIPHSGLIQDDGTFSVPGIPTGPVKIGVSSPDPREQRVAMRKKDQEIKPAPVMPKWIAIPDQFADPDKSDLTFTVKHGKNSFNIDLK